MVWYNVITVVAVVVAVVFTLIVLITGKGDAMSGGTSGVRTSFKGKASFEDKMFSITIWLGAIFMVLMVVLDFLAERIFSA
ncbi:MAG: preprotein translocase subunit SecG [Fimbriimonadaceae bacterium]